MSPALGMTQPKPPAMDQDSSIPTSLPADFQQAARGWGTREQGLSRRTVPMFWHPVDSPKGTETGGFRRRAASPCCRLREPLLSREQTQISGSLFRRVLATPVSPHLKLPCWRIELEQDTKSVGKGPRTQICRDT